MISAHQQMDFLKDLNAQFPAGDDEYKLTYLELKRDENVDEWWRLNELIQEKPEDKEVAKMEESQEHCRKWTFYLTGLIMMTRLATPTTIEQ